jgi:hypothetical protein
MSTMKSHLEALSSVLQIDALQLDATGLRSLWIDRSVVVHLQADAARQEWVLFAVVGSLPPQPSPAVLMRLLRANRFGRGTAGATLSLDEQTPAQVILGRRVSWTSHTEAQFVAIFESFVDHARHWKSAVEAPVEQEVSRLVVGQMA